MIRTSTLALAAMALAACAAETPRTSGLATNQSADQLFVPSVQPTGFDKTLSSAREAVDAAMAAPIAVPVPKDAGGGYTHEKHKDNARLIFNAGALYRFTGEEKYASFVADLLEEYATVYPNWGQHPAKKEQSPGRMFWQNLNESWWLVHAAQGYESIHGTLSEEQREHIEANLLRNMSDFLSEGSPETFNKVHNHGTWATAAVGITGYAIGDDAYVEKALLGLDLSGEGGFLRQMDVLFSPDGYYNEGPYYQRYALMPFVLFAKYIEQNEPEREIFEVRDGILKKAIESTIHQNYGGLFFPINDALKDKGIATTELLHGVAIAYDLTGDPGLLSIAEAQGKFVLTPESKKVADAIAAGKSKPFDYRSMRLLDGQGGTEGALDILRVSDDPDDQALVMKHTSQGLGHGHFDKLGMLYYDNGNEILRDYGAARFLNIEAKYGGHYLPENNLYAKQTIAHNTLVVDETSHFNGKTATGNKFAPELGPFITTTNLQLSSAKTSDAYPGTELSRKTAIIRDAAFARPVIIDIVQAKSSGSHQYDLPFHYNGQLIDTNFEISADSQSRSPLGEKNGYQYIWKTGQAEPVNDLSQLTFLLDDRFYTLSTATPDNTTILLAETGANDPNFNLRREPALVLRAEKVSDASFVTVIESHGEYDPTLEFTVNSHSSVASVSHREETGYDRVDILSKAGQTVTLLLADSNEEFETTDASGNSIKWQGPAHLLNSQ
ncbi:hypothetical protein GCM10011309_09720 [Litorimonas cladophorae]|uniref:Alginate lyase n=1 Tax=Litorimonas cladophorae TaxID=1220491 RepID=A0A918NES8_9PROT|nr:heparinase II/III family protein [Litorimonas cladophorae]GGX61832.1 hypothetical protein GCM10011309_09720 [Litorimonas cladophorae]